MRENSLSNSERYVRIRWITYRRLSESLKLCRIGDLHVDAIGLEQLQRPFEVDLHLGGCDGGLTCTLDHLGCRLVEHRLDRTTVCGRVHVVGNRRAVTEPEGGDDGPRVGAIEATQVHAVRGAAVPVGKRVRGDVLWFTVLVKTDHVLLKRAQSRVFRQLGEEGISHGEQAVRAERDSVGERGFAVGFDGQELLCQLFTNLRHVHRKAGWGRRWQVPESPRHGGVPSFGSYFAAAAKIIPQLLFGPRDGLILRGVDILREEMRYFRSRRDCNLRQKRTG